MATYLCTQISIYCIHISVLLYTIFSAFIVYAKEENDPDGEQVRCLSDLLYNSRINCDIDLYHINDNNINSDWPYWVEINLRNYITYPHSYVILVCSPTMSSSLGNADAYVEMVAAHIHSQNLRPYLQQYAENFLPLLITNPSTDYVPPSLSKQTCYYFPYDKLNDMSENVSTLEVLDHPDFASLKKLVATLTGPFVAEVKQGGLYIIWFICSCMCMTCISISQLRIPII